MDSSNKAIAKRINEELKKKGWGQQELLKKLIEAKNPDISKIDLRNEVEKNKGNFSTSLKTRGDCKRPIPKEDLYFISKLLEVSFEYIWFGEEEKRYTMPQGARYVAYQDSENAYRTYIANLEYEDKIQEPDEFGFCLFDYLGQYESIVGYRFFEKNKNLHFDYKYDQLVYINGEGKEQFCSSFDKDYLSSENLLRTLIKHKDITMFKKVFFHDSSWNRFEAIQFYDKNEQLFSKDFLETLLENEPFLDEIIQTRIVAISTFNKNYDRREKRSFVEPMFYEALNYALSHEKEYDKQLFKMLSFALDYNESQYNFVKEYLKAQNEERRDAYIDLHTPRFLKYGSRSVPMGNIFSLKSKTSNEDLNKLLNEIEKYAFATTHINNKQERNNGEIKISTPDNSLFVELHKNAFKQNISFVPTIIHTNDEFTYFQYYESMAIDYINLKHIKFVVDCLNKAQNLVEPKQNKVLVHGNLNGAILMTEKENLVGLAGWQNCHYGNKYEDRAELLSNFDVITYYDEHFKKYEEIFEIVSQGFDSEEKMKLISKTTDLLKEKMKSTLAEGDGGVTRAYQLKEKSSKWEFFRELYLKK